MKAYQIVSALDEARQGSRFLREDTAPVAASPSHAPTSTAQWKTPSSGKSKDEGSRTGGEKDAIKKSDSAIPAPVAKAPSHAPTSTAQWKTGGEATSKDDGEKISKEAMKEDLVNVLLADDEADIEAIMDEAEISEGGHKAGCQCGFCKNKGKFGKKAKEEGNDDGENKEEKVSEGRMPMHRSMGRPMGRPQPSAGRRLGGNRMNFHHPSATRPKATSLPGGAMSGNQPSMESRRSIQNIADELLTSPEDE
jgi:hypothetical protein